jgi:hypothetical protein
MHRPPLSLTGQRTLSQVGWCGLGLLLRPVVRAHRQPRGAWPIVEELLQCIQHQDGIHRPLCPPAHDAAREHVDDERHVDEALLT